MKLEWLLCPICKSKTRLQLRKDTELKNFPLYCLKCKQQSLIDVKELILHIKIIKNKVDSILFICEDFSAKKPLKTDNATCSLHLESAKWWCFAV